MRTIAVVGGGPAGMMAALVASKDINNKIFLIERQPRIGKKLLATGNGQCNMSNTHILSRFFHGRDPDFAMPALKRFGVSNTIDFFKNIGLLVKVEQDGKVYPYSKRANSVVDVLRHSLNKSNIKILTDCTVENIAKHNKIFSIQTNNKTELIADKTIVTTGGMASPQLSGSSLGYDLMIRLGHSVTEIKPSLVQIKTDTSCIKPLKGVKVIASVSVLRHNTEKVFSNTDEILFTEYGVSGPAIFKASGYTTAHDTLSLDFMPDYAINQIESLLKSSAKIFNNMTLDDLFVGIMNKRLGQTIVKYSRLDTSREICSLVEREFSRIAQSVKHFKLRVTGHMGFRNAQVTSGGIMTSDFNSETLESKLCEGLFAAGEVLDIDGDCGGYNLQWAWSSGFIAGMLGQY